MKRVPASAPGEEPADAVFTGGILFNPFDCSWEETSLAVEGIEEGAAGEDQLRGLLTQR